MIGIWTLGSECYEQPYWKQISGDAQPSINAAARYFDVPDVFGDYVLTVLSSTSSSTLGDGLGPFAESSGTIH